MRITALQNFIASGYTENAFTIEQFISRTRLYSLPSSLEENERFWERLCIQCFGMLTAFSKTSALNVIIVFEFSVISLYMSDFLTVIIDYRFPRTRRSRPTWICAIILSSGSTISVVSSKKFTITKRRFSSNVSVGDWLLFLVALNSYVSNLSAYITIWSVHSNHFHGTLPYGQFYLLYFTFCDLTDTKKCCWCGC